LQETRNMPRSAGNDISQDAVSTHLWSTNNNSPSKQWYESLNNVVAAYEFPIWSE
jgi:hypothetical protein